MSLASAARIGTVFCAVLTVVVAVAVCRAEDLEPTGPPGSAITSRKFLNEVEPRTCVTSLPYTVTNSGAYYLTRNLDGVAGSNGIVIAASNVRLDLNGFALLGKTNALSGIYVSGARNNLVIRDGVVNGWGASGIDAFNAKDSQFIELLCCQNGKDGISSGFSSFVSHCGTHSNGWRGVITQEGSTVTDCKAEGNKMHGFMCYSATRVQNCTARENVMDGLWAKDNCDVRDCVSTWNTNNGIQVTSQCTVMNNHCGANAQAGIRVAGSGSRIEGNNLVANSNAVDAAVAGGNLLVRNSSAGSRFTAFVVSSNNFYGAILTTNNMSRYGFSTNNPWANFQY